MTIGETPYTVHAWVNPPVNGSDAWCGVTGHARLVTAIRAEVTCPACLDRMEPAIANHDPDPVEPEMMRAVGVTLCQACGEKLRLRDGAWEHFGAGKPFEAMEIRGR